ncbi:hypothetical protein OHC33_009617 [Knufia fluminis]|uniref:S-adenosyl-L-methionine-dependent methyltransferase n=1 Tax=Knufia fluminis TaxID=191047 RepID=A0AAN8E9W0_9EURO|nr:hypothetical protein OHC33_009617 [Knufia fluminis]
MGVAACYFFLAALLNPRLALTLQIDKIRFKAFAMFWKLFGKTFANDVPSPDLDDMITQYCHGKVLDIGPGGGYQIKRFNGAYQRGQIETIYGVEPGVEMHDDLKAEAMKTFGGDATKIYKILISGAEPNELVPTLAKQDMLATEGIFDTIITLRALCGIPQPKETVDLFYRLLKPGGRIIFFEHVVNSCEPNRGGSRIAWLFQQAYMLMGWSFWSGGCELTRDTAKNLMNAAAVDGGWADVKILDRNPGGCVPEIYGYMQKKVAAGQAIRVTM